MMLFPVLDFALLFPKTGTIFQELPEILVLLIF
jgi:hypothetical protein